MFDEAQAEVLSLMRSDLFSVCEKKYYFTKYNIFWVCFFNFLLTYFFSQSFAGTEIAKRLAARLNKKDFSLFIPSYTAMGYRKDAKEKDVKLSKSNSILSS